MTLSSPKSKRKECSDSPSVPPTTLGGGLKRSKTSFDFSAVYTSEAVSDLTSSCSDKKRERPAIKNDVHEDWFFVDLDCDLESSWSSTRFAKFSGSLASSTKQYDSPFQSPRVSSFGRFEVGTISPQNKQIIQTRPWWCSDVNAKVFSEHRQESDDQAVEQMFRSMNLAASRNTWQGP